MSNTSPLFNLAAIDQLPLLRHAFEKILIPDAVGVLGILLRAKREGHLESVKELMTALRDEVGFYIHQSLFQKVLHLAGEA